MTTTTTMSTTPANADRTGAGSQVTVLGLGDMGSAMAKTLVDRGYRTTVWNRTPSKCAPLVEAAATTAEAVAASPLALICLLDSAAVDELSSVDAAVTGKVLVHRRAHPRRISYDLAIEVFG